MDGDVGLCNSNSISFTRGIFVTKDWPLESSAGWNSAESCNSDFIRVAMLPDECELERMYNGSVVANGSE